MIAVLVELVGVQSRRVGVQGGAEFFGEDVVAEPLRGGDLRRIVGDQQRVPAGPGGCGGGEDNGHAELCKAAGYQVSVNRWLVECRSGERRPRRALGRVDDPDRIP